jgi:diguanylate cyclase (GGDEF)-like protein
LRIDRLTFLWWRKCLWHFLAFVSLFSCVSAAQAQHYTFAQFGQKDGLLNLDVGAIVQDTRGVLWVGTENGLFQADGSQFLKVSGYADAQYGAVLAMHVDAAGRIWVLGARALMYFDANDHCHLMDALALGLASDHEVGLTSLPNEPDQIYVLAGGRFVTLNTTNGGANWQISLASTLHDIASDAPLPVLRTLVADPSRRVLWAGCGGGLCELKIPPTLAIDRSISVVRWGAAQKIPEDAYTSILVTAAGKVWARGGARVLQLDPATGTVTDVGDPSGGGAPKLRYSMLLEDRDGSILANLPEGLARLRDGNWQRIGASSGLPTSQISTMFSERSGGFWLAPIGSGLWRWLGYTNWQHWTRNEGMSGNVIWNMLRDHSGDLWIAATNDLDHLVPEQGGGMHMVPQGSGAPIEEVQAIGLDVRGHIWSGTSDGRLIDFDPVSRKQRLVSSSLDFVYAVHGVDNSDPRLARVWIGSTHGAAYVSGDDGWTVVHPVRGPGIPAQDVTAIKTGVAGDLWFSGPDGIFRLHENHWYKLQVPQDAKLMPNAVIGPAPDGSLFVQGSLPSPLVHIAIDHDVARVIGGVPPGLIETDDLSFIKVDSRKWLWVGTDLGIFVTNGNRWVQVTQEDGLISDDTDTNGVFEDADGSMWFGTAGGLSHVLRPAMLFSVPPPQISVKDVRLDGRALRGDIQEEFNLRHPELTARLFATYYTRPRAVAFRYRLLGLDEAWQTSKDGGFSFPGLPPGDYTLQVQATDVRMHTFSPVIEYRFTVLPPWYKRTVSILVVCSLLIVFIGITWRYSILRLRDSEIYLKAQVDAQTAELLKEKAELERIQIELLETTRRDGLTGLLNRAAIFEILARLCMRAKLDRSELTVVMADLDHFKLINDRFGHLVGDAVLRECAERLSDTLRPGDAVGRYGGEELILIIPGLRPRQAAARMEEIRLAIASKPFIHGDHSLHVTCSFGVAWLREDCSEVEHMVVAADAALYQAKRNGRNRVEFTPDAEDEVHLQGRFFV